MDEDKRDARERSEDREAAIMAKYRVGDPTPEEQKLIESLVFLRDHVAVREALSAGASPLIEYMGRPMAYWAALDVEDNALPEIARACCRLGVEDILDNEGRSLMHYATLTPSPRTMSLLFSRGADPDDPSHGGGHTVLMVSCMVGSAECAGVALAYGASVDALDGKGQTALFHAARRGHAQCASLLLEAGANPKIKDASGVAPWDVAQAEGSLECLAVLEAWELGAPEVGLGKPGAGAPRI